jgi:hypothetical protein
VYDSWLGRSVSNYAFPIMPPDHDPRRREHAACQDQARKTLGSAAVTMITKPRQVDPP